MELKFKIESIGQFLRVIRAIRKDSIRDVAYRSGKSHTYLSEVERNHASIKVDEVKDFLFRSYQLTGYDKKNFLRLLDLSEPEKKIQLRPLALEVLESLLRLSVKERKKVIQMAIAYDSAS